MARPKLKQFDDWIVRLRLRRGVDNDLIDKLEQIPSRQRSAWIRSVLRGAPADSIPTNNAALDPTINASLDALATIEW